MAGAAAQGQSLCTEWWWRLLSNRLETARKRRLLLSFTLCFRPHWWVSAYYLHSGVCASSLHSWVLRPRICSLSVSCPFRKPDGDSLLLVDQTSAFLSLQPCRSCSIAPTGRKNVFILFSEPLSEAVLERCHSFLTFCLALKSQFSLPFVRAFQFLSRPTQCLRKSFLLSQWSYLFSHPPRPEIIPSSSTLSSYSE